MHPWLVQPLGRLREAQDVTLWINVTRVILPS